MTDCLELPSQPVLVTMSGSPRCGKTFMMQNILKQYESINYFSGGVSIVSGCECIAQEDYPNCIIMEKFDLLEFLLPLLQENCSTRKPRAIVFDDVMLDPVAIDQLVSIHRSLNISVFILQQFPAKMPTKRHSRHVDMAFMWKVSRMICPEDTLFSCFGERHFESKQEFSKALNNCPELFSCLLSSKDSKYSYVVAKKMAIKSNN